MASPETTARDELVVERSDGVVHVLLDAPETRNSVAVGTLRRLVGALRDVDSERDRALVLSSATPGSFCSGFRLDERAADAMRSGEAHEVAQEAYALLSGSPLPTIAVVDGPAHGGGCELALRCDIRIASERATFAVPAARHGFAYSLGSLQFLVDRYGHAPIAWLFLAGARMGASDALRAGLVQRVVPAGELDHAVRDVLDAVRSGAPLVVQYLVTALSARPGDAEPARLALERVQESEDFDEALRAVTERRPPRFTGR